MYNAPLTRERPQGNILILDAGKEVIVESAELLARFGVDGIIRIRDAEYAGINKALGYLGHFNLETAGNVVGSRNALPRIIRQGHYDVTSGVEVLPLLSFEQIYTAVCVRCEERIAYDDLTAEYFQYPIGDVRDAPALKTLMLDRYGRSLWGVSNEELLARGVAYTLLRFE